MLRSTHVTVDLDAFLQNVRVARNKLLPETKLMCIIKANAYGHGIARVGTYLDTLPEVYGFGVAITEEGVVLREAGVRKPILVIGATDEAHMAASVAQDLTVTLFAVDALLQLERAAAAAGKRVPFHLKLDTGMRRIGIADASALDAFLDVLPTCGHVYLDGVFTHFAKSESDPAFTAVQAERFDRFVAHIRERGYAPTVHAANSAAILLHPELQYDMVRFGIALYGSHPNPALTKRSGLVAPMRFVTRISNVKTIEAGVGVSYGLRFVANRPSVIATLPVGYGDGYKRSLTNRSDVLIHGKRCPQVGTVCMDQIMVDVTGMANVSIGDEAVLIGRQGEETITADELAEKAGTISYEILLSISERVPRVYLTKGETPA